MSDIFISYAKKDIDKVRPLAEALEAHGWSVWLDVRIRSGTPFDRVIEQALDEARTVLAIWSQTSVESDWVRLEAADGLERNILVSVAIEPNLRLPLRFRYIHTELLIDWDRGKPSFPFDKIVGDLEAIIGPRKASGKTADKRMASPYPDLVEMVKVPAGEFIYQDGKAIIETPFMIDIYPVTNQQYDKFIKAGGYQNQQLWSRYGKGWLTAENKTQPKLWNYDKWNQPEQPVVGVNYYEAEAFARWAEKRLPTEKEWERAARGTDGRQYPWGNEFDKNKCNANVSEKGKTTPVIQYLNGISPVGCYDMAANVGEWTNSWYNHERAQRVLRGGSWSSNIEDVQCAYRNMSKPSKRSGRIGFRCAMT